MAEELRVTLKQWEKILRISTIVLNSIIVIAGIVAIKQLAPLASIGIVSILFATMAIIRRQARWILIIPIAFAAFMMFASNFAVNISTFIMPVIIIATNGTLLLRKNIWN